MPAARVSKGRATANQGAELRRRGGRQQGCVGKPPTQADSPGGLAWASCAHFVHKIRRPVLRQYRVSKIWLKLLQIWSIVWAYWSTLTVKSFVYMQHKLCTCGAHIAGLVNVGQLRAGRIWLKAM
jgi:hypothetical protein